MTLSYDGTHFSGWQVQPNATSIQALTENALTTALRCQTHLVGAGRTDAGVHAKAQVAHFSTEVSFSIEKLLASLNGLLPRDIRILNIEEMPADFHARYSAKSKTYRYYLSLTPVQLPLRRLYALHLPYPLDISLLKKGCAELVGTHDFTSFSNEAHRGSAARNPVRTLKTLELIEGEEEIYLEFEADGFLYKMVRNITGTLLEIARGKLPLETLQEILHAKDRKRAGPAASAHGLILHAIDYQ